VRVGFILCGIIATVFAAKTAQRLTNGDSRAGAVDGVGDYAHPLSSVAFGSASPDGPYLAAWAATLYCAVRAFETHLRRHYVWLGIALGAVLLTRIFAFALVFGIVMYALAPGRRRYWARRVVAVVRDRRPDVRPVPDLEFKHGWATFVFALVNRHERTGAGTSRSCCT